MNLETGARFAGYRVLRMIGQGGMGQVYLVEHPHLGRLEALKLIAVDHGDPQFEERFTREARTAAALKHPGIVTIYHYGIEERTPWLTMDFVDGADLASGQHLTSVEVGVVIVRAAEALDYAHHHGVVHRDVKPANIMVTRAEDSTALDRVVLLDFGIARLMSGARLTATSAFIGTFRYAAPEVLEGVSATDRADQYSLASTAFELLTGRAPFTAEHPGALVAAQLTQPPMLPSETSPDLAPVDHCMRRALAREPAARYPTCADFAHEFTAALLHVGPTSSPAATQVVARPPRPGIGPTVSPESLRAQRAGPIAAMGYSAAHESSSPPPASGGAAPGPGQQAVGPMGPPSQSSWPSQPQSHQSQPPLVSSSRPAKGRRRKLLWAALVAGVLAVALLAVVGVSVFRSNGESNASSTDGALPGTFVPLTEINADGSVAAHDENQALDPRGSGHATCPVTTIAWAGPLSGERTERASGMRNGVGLAVSAHNEANPGCQVRLREFDTEGTPERAAQLPAGILGDPSVVGLVGPWTSGEAFAMGPALNTAGLVFASPSATSPKLVQSGWRTFFRGTITDQNLGVAAANYMSKTRRFNKVCVVGNDSDSSSDLAPTVAANLGQAAAVGCVLTVTRGANDYSEQVSRIKQIAPDAVFYAGTYLEASALVRQLRAAAVTSVFLAGPDSVYNPRFPATAGPAASRSLVTCPCGPATPKFSAAYRDKFQQEPFVFASESYDLATIMLAAIDSGVTTRAAMADYFRRYSGSGMARDYQWSANGELTFPRAWVFEVS